MTCLGEALYEYRKELPVWRGQNEQSMAMAAIAYAKQKLRRRFMFATASAGPGTTNMVTAAAIAHTNRLPVLLLCGDGYATRLPDPVLQQVEHFGNPDISVTRRLQIRVALLGPHHPSGTASSSPCPRAIATMLDPADCGPAFLALPQDVQGWAYDYPVEFFAERMHRIRRQSPDRRDIADAAALLKTAERPVIIAGGGVQYSGATAELAALCRGAQHSRGRDHRRPRQPVLRSPAELRPDRCHRFKLGQCHCGEGRCDSGRRHTAAGLHHRLMDGLFPRRPDHHHQCRPL